MKNCEFLSGALKAAFWSIKAAGSRHRLHWLSSVGHAKRCHMQTTAHVTV